MVAYLLFLASKVEKAQEKNANKGAHLWERVCFHISNDGTATIHHESARQTGATKYLRVGAGLPALDYGTYYFESIVRGGWVW